jgi:subtilisin family serine protease
MGGRVGGAADEAVAVNQTYTPNRTPAGDLVVGVVDTGIAKFHGGTHPWFADHLYDDPPVDELPAEGEELDELPGHGTFVAGLILREAPAVKVRMVRPKSWEDSDVKDAILELSDCQLINLSFAGTEVEKAAPEPIVEALHGLDEGAVVVIAAGNRGVSSLVYPAAIRTSAVRARIIAVGAVDETRTGRYGGTPPVAGFSNFGRWVDCYAAGVQVLGPHLYYNEQPSSSLLSSSLRGWARWSGTSFATATVTGVIARYVLDHPGVSVSDAAQTILDTARPIPVRQNEAREVVEWKPHIRGVDSLWGEVLRGG